MCGFKKEVMKIEIERISDIVMGSVKSKWPEQSYEEWVRLTSGYCKKRYINVDDPKELFDIANEIEHELVILPAKGEGVLIQIADDIIE